MNKLQETKIRKANLLDAKACAEIHQHKIHTGFLSQLGVRFLQVLYTSIVTSQHTFCAIAKDEDGQVAGFIAGCFDVSMFYRQFFVKHGLKVLLILIPQMVKPAILKKILEMVKYPFSVNDADKSIKKDDLPEAELFSIAVEEHIMGTGGSQKLAHALFDECRKRGIQELKVVVATRNYRANRFYEKIGFELHSNIAIHGSEVSNILVKRLSCVRQSRNT